MKFFFSVLSLFIAFVFSCSKPVNNKKIISGYSFGTSFSIQFEKSNDENIIKYKIDSLFKIVNNSFSTYISDSDISKINRGDSLLVVDDHFKKVFLKSYEIWELSQGFLILQLGL